MPSPTSFLCLLTVCAFPLFLNSAVMAWPYFRTWCVVKLFVHGTDGQAQLTTALMHQPLHSCVM
jgi:hypothetical protein